MSLYTNPRAILVSDGNSSFSSSDAGRGTRGHAYGGPRRYDDAYYSHHNGGSDNSGSSENSSVEDLVHRRFHGRYTDFERDLGSAAGLSGSPFRGRVDGGLGGGRERFRSEIFVDRDPRRDPRHGLDEGPDTEAEDAAYLQRLHRGLMEMRMKERLEKPALTGTDGKPKKKVVVIEETFTRLCKPNASMKAKAQEKYEDRALREQMEKVKPVRVSEAATRAGQRLHLQAKAQHKEQEKVREAQRERDKEAEEQFTFQPTITPLAHQLATQGYRTVEDRAEDYKLQKEEQERRRIELQVAEMHKHPFRPTLSKGTRAIVEERRSASRSRDRSRSGGRRGNRSRSRPLDDDAGERLYRDGGERLLRQQLRRRLVDLDAGRNVIGHNVKLTRGRQCEVNERLDAWQRTREGNVASLREDAERLAREGQLPRSSVPSAEVAAAVERLVPGSSQPAARPRPVNRASSQPARTASKNSVKRAAKEPTAATRQETDGVSPVPSASPVVPLPAVRCDPFARFTAKQKAVYDELRAIRFGALFYKYTAGSATDVVALAKIQRMIDVMYPEDAGVLEAIESSMGDNPKISVAKDGFIAALMAYERQHGPQPWARTAKDALLFPLEALVSTGPAASAASAAASVASFEPGLVRSASLPSKSSRGGSSSRAPAGSRPSDGESASTYRCSSSQQTRPGGTAAVPSPRTFSRTASACDQAAAVAGYASHVARMRSHSPGGRAYARAASSPEECTFAPRLSRRAERLSNIELERRAGYALEVDLRRRELELMRHLTGAEGPRPTTAVTSARPAARGHSPANNSGSLSGPSIELSSLSGSAGCSPLPPQPQPQPQRPAVPSSHPRANGIAASTAMRELQALLSGKAGRAPCPKAFAAANSQPPKLEAPKAFASKPSTATSGPFSERELNALFDDMYRKSRPRTGDQ